MLTYGLPASWKKQEPRRAEIVALKTAVVSKIPEDMLAEATKLVTAIYKAKGGNDKAAKGSAFQKQLIVALGNRHPKKSH